MSKKITLIERKKVKDILGNILLNIPIEEKIDDLSNITDVELDDHIKELQKKLNFAKKIKTEINKTEKNVENIYFNSKNKTTGWLSNFSPHPIVINNIKYNTVEHFYQSQKFNDKKYQEQIRLSNRPNEAKKLGQSRIYKIKDDWEQIKEEIMFLGLKEKFLQHSILKKKLINTGNCLLIEHLKDKYWGDGLDGSGLNKTGILIMKVRDFIKNNEKINEKKINNIINDFSLLSINNNIKIDYNKLTFVELFCGLGVFHMSINNIIKENQYLLSCDINDDVKNIYNLNFNQMPEDDVLQINLDRFEKIDLIVGSPPCQSFSVAGKKLGIEDIRGELIFNTLDLIGKYQPKYSILENVRNILKISKGLVLKMIIQKCKEIGYYLKYFLTNPKMINIPQNRDRVYFILIRKDLTDENIIYKLEKNYNTLIEKYKEKNKNVCYSILDKNLIDDLPLNIKLPIDLFNELILQLPNEKQNIDLNYLWYNENVKKINNLTYKKMKYIYFKYKEIFDNFYNKNKIILDELPKTKKVLEWTTGTNFSNIWDFNIQYRQSGIRVKDINKYPCLTKSGQRLIIGKEKRFITIKECSRLQSFKDDYIFLNDDKINYQMLGNSINIQITTLIIDTLFSSLNNNDIKENYNYNNEEKRKNQVKELLQENNMLSFSTVLNNLINNIDKITNII